MEPAFSAWTAPLCRGRTPIGRVTVAVLNINDAFRVERKRVADRGRSLPALLVAIAALPAPALIVTRATAVTAIWPNEAPHTLSLAPDRTGDTRMSRPLAIPPEALGRFVLGEITIRELGCLCHAHQDRVGRALRTLGVDTSPGAHKRRRAARRAEQTAQLPPGSAYETAARIYRQGGTLQEVADTLGSNQTSAAHYLCRLDETIRPDWWREVFRHPDGRHMDLTPFAETLRAMRLSRGWSQKRLAEECGLSQQCISQPGTHFPRPELGHARQAGRQLARISALPGNRCHNAMLHGMMHGNP